MSTKCDQLRQLALERQRDRWPGYRCIGDFHDGAYECEFVSPYTKSARNHDAAIFVLLQDWSSEDRLSGPLDRDAIEYGLTPSLPTNRRLNQLLGRFLDVALADTYATNLFPFIKPGSLSARIPFKDLVRAAREYALLQISIVSPRLVICLGVNTFRAIQQATDRSPSTNLASAIASPFEFGNIMVWCQAHPGGLGQAGRNRGNPNRVAQDWDAMRQAFESTAGVTERTWSQPL
jgi:restriction system protein